jgi:aminoglycoside phosphotransferase (APT) family kinase protein
MDLASEVRTGEELDWSKLSEYLQSNLDEAQGDMVVKQFHGGHANLTYLLRFGEQEFVLRRPPFGKIAPGAHDMHREYKVLSKLYKHFDPAPRAYHYCEEETIIGSPFVIMQRCTGSVIRGTIPKGFKKHDNLEQRLTDALIHAQASLHTIDVQAANLQDLGKPEGFVERQLKGWSTRWHLAKTEEIKEMDEVMETLQKDIPKPQAVSILHNDYKFDNCQFQEDNPDLVTSIFDWDMCTTGDPLIDFGSTLSYWPDERFADVQLPIIVRGNFPNKAYLKEAYARQTAFDLSRMDWYESFALWKNAIILQQLYARYVNGATQDKRMAAMGTLAKLLAKVSKQVILG